MFWKGEKFNYSVSEIAFFETAIQYHTDEILKNNHDELQHRSKRGLFMLTLGVAKNCSCLLQSAIDDFSAIARHNNANPVDIALSKTNISLVHKALRNMEALQKQA